MTLSVSEVFREAPSSAAFDMRDEPARAASSGCRDIEFALPAHLARFGGTTRLRVSGDRSAPVVLALGGISGDRFVCSRPGSAGGWWPGLVGRGCAVDPERHCVVGLDFAADPTGGEAPTTAEQAEVLAAALDAIGCRTAEAIVGASYGGMVALAFAERFPDRVRRLVVISAGGEPHPVASAARELQRRVVGLGLASGQADEALSIARGMAMLTYRTAEEFAERFEGGLADSDPLGCTGAGGYLRARGEAFRRVMSPERFLSLSASIDRHDVDAARIATPVLLIGAESDLLVPAEQLRSLAHRLGDKAELHLRPSLYGHDMFLKEAEAVGRIAAEFLGR